MDGGMERESEDVCDGGLGSEEDVEDEGEDEDEDEDADEEDDEEECGAKGFIVRDASRMCVGGCEDEEDDDGAG